MVNALLALASQLTEANQDELQFKETKRMKVQKQQRWPALIQIEVVLELEYK
jgi:hypothetical protein